jgi:glycosyltransferase involved in cell wall biosynthesis
MKRRVLVYSNDVIGSRMAGPGIRSYHFARELSRDFTVTLAAPAPPDLDVPGIAVAVAPPRDAGAAIALLRRHDAVVAQRLPAAAMIAAAKSDVRVVYDLYTPALLEDLAYEAGGTHLPPTSLIRDPDLPVADGEKHGQLWVAADRLVQRVVMLTGDAFVCASERQRDFYLGVLAATGRMTSADYRTDPSLRELVDVVPFGLDPTPPARSSAGLRASFAAVELDDVVLVWGGGIWNWFDPLTVIRAVAELASVRPKLRLVFLGIRHPNPEIEEMTMTRRALELASDLGLRDSVVFFNDNWVPYQERGAWLADADIGVSAHFDDVETRLSFRTRLLDYVWAGLPTVTTAGDDLGERIARAGGGFVVPVEDVDSWVQTLGRLADDAPARAEARRALDALRPQFTWPRVVERLAELLERPGRPRPLQPTARLLAERERLIRARLSVSYRGVRGALRHQVQKLR